MWKPQRPDDPENLWKMLGLVVELRSSEDQTTWTVASIFWAANALLLLALFQEWKDGSLNNLRIILSVVGLAFSAVWFFVQGRGLAHIRRYEDLIKTYEQKLGYVGDFAHLAQSPEINVEQANKFLGGKVEWTLRMSRSSWARIGSKVISGTLFSARGLMCLSALGGMAGWGSFLGLFVYRAAH